MAIDLGLFQRIRRVLKRDFTCVFGIHRLVEFRMIILLCYKIIISNASSTVATIAEHFELNNVLCALHSIQPEGNPQGTDKLTRLPGRF